MTKGLMILSIQVSIFMAEQTLMALEDLEEVVQRWWP